VEPDAVAASDAALLEERIDGEPVFEGRLLQVFRDRVRLPDGGTAFREYVDHPGAVMVVPLLEPISVDAPLRVVVERQFRYPIGQVMIEFPAGKRERDEDGLICAVRELREETGFSAREWAYAGSLHPLVAYSTERIEVWFARGLEPGPTQLDPGEFVETVVVDFPWLLEACQDGRVTDAKTIVGAFWLQERLRHRDAIDWQPAPNVAG
jgi:ADP-ribose pyrophosphatase